MENWREIYVTSRRLVGSLSDPSNQSLLNRYNVHKIEKLAQVVDESILKVDILKESNLFDTGGGDYHMKVLLNSEKYERPATRMGFEERVNEFTRQFFKWVPIRQEVLNKYRKNSNVSQTLRERGNGFFRSGNLEDALESFNLAVMFAPLDAPELGLAYANRSAALLELGHGVEALQDIDLALKSNYPESLVAKLVQRRGRCEAVTQAKLAAISEEVRSQVEEERNERKKIRDSMSTIASPNPRMPAAADFVEMKFSEKFGRHLVVNRAVPAGTLLVAEDPFAAALNGGASWDSDHCYQCFKRIRRGIPCNGCVFALFCSDSCVSKAQPIHQYECKCLPYLHINSTFLRYLVDLRIVLKVGADELFRIYSTKDPAYYSQNEVPFGVDPGIKYESDSYLPVHHLAAQLDSYMERDLLEPMHTHVLMTWILDTQTDFFHRIPRNQKDGFKNFVASLMLRRLDSKDVCYNSICEHPAFKNFTLEDCFTGRIHPDELASQIEQARSVGIGSGMYPVGSLVTHSCDGNAYGMNGIVDGRQLVISKRALRQGERITIPVAGPFTETPKAVRQGILRSTFIQCDCLACIKDWPILEEFPRDGDKATFTCADCSRKFFEFLKDPASPLFKKCILGSTDGCSSTTKGFWKCELCSKQYDRRVLQLQLRMNCIMTIKALCLVRQNQPREGVEKIYELLDFFQFQLCPPHYHRYALEEELRKALCLIFYYSE